VLSKEWFSAAEIAAATLPGVPSSESGVVRLAKSMLWMLPETEGECWRPRSGRGGGREFHYSLLPPKARLEIVRRFGAPARIQEFPRTVASTIAISTYTRASNKKKATAEFRLQVIAEVDAEQRLVGRTKAIENVATAHGVAPNTVRNWLGRLAGVEKHDAAAALVPGFKGRTSRAFCPDEAWDYLLSLYLRPNQPTFLACFREVQALVDEKGWRLPSKSCLERRIVSDVPVPVRVLYRDGEEALRRLYPSQERDRSMFHALECVNADGHKWDMMVLWPDGYVGRPMMVAFQDLYSNLILSWRIDRSENKEAVRLAYGDMVETYGIPEHCWLDNGRSFASKWLTGGVQNRFRFKIKEEDPHGILRRVCGQLRQASSFCRRRNRKQPTAQASELRRGRNPA
jgi:putative transposase